MVATPQDATSWHATARRVADCGYSTLLMPDGLQLLSPFPSLAATAATVPELRVGTFVLAAPLRPPRAAAWEGHSMTVLTDGRFDFGIGTGLPRARQWADQLGLPYRSGPERLADVATAVEHLRELDGQAAMAPTSASTPETATSPSRSTSSPSVTATCRPGPSR